MTNIAIKDIINATNTNRQIVWDIAVNTPYKIVLTNSYDNCVSYSIKVGREGQDQWISVRDNHMDKTVAFFIGDESNWGDYTETEQGVKMAIESAVRNFNYMY